MIKLSKLTDYSFVLLTRFADSPPEKWHTARDLADTTGLPLPTVSKLLKVFSRGGLLSAHRGAYGGYSLSRDADKITVSDIIEVIDGPIAITDCACETNQEPCAIEDRCPTKSHWARIATKIRTALDEITLAQLAVPACESLTTGNAISCSCQEAHCTNLPGESCTSVDHIRHSRGETIK